MQTINSPYQDQFELYDIRVEVSRCQSGRKMICNHKIGDYFVVSGENLKIPNGKTFPIYPLASLLTLIPVKQRETHPNDWISTDQEVACPDPNCGGIFKLIRLKKRSFRHSEVTVTKLVRKEENHE